MPLRTRQGPPWIAYAAVTLLLTLAIALAPGEAEAGPPYLTDDPDPVAYQHWELYLASQWDHVGSQTAEGSLPHVEVNFGVVNGAMLHVLVPAAFSTSRMGGTVYGVGDLEVGSNIRILEEGGPAWIQMGTFPIATIPTGNEGRGLGSKTAELFLPIWLMKHLGAWAIDGGGGVSFSDGDTHGEFGAFAQRPFGDVLSVGAEVFVTVPFDGSLVRTQPDLALILDLSDTHHLLFSGGPSFGAVGGSQAYVAWLVTL
jgi:hypothetical protein